MKQIHATANAMNSRLLNAGSMAEHARIYRASSMLNQPQQAASKLTEITAMLSDPNPAMRHFSVALLGKTGPAGVPALAQALSEKQPRAIRIAAAQHLAQSGPAAAPAGAALCQCLNDPDPLVRYSAQQALVKIGGPAVPQLRDMLNSPSSTARASAALALGQATPPPGTEVVNDLRRIAASSPAEAKPGLLAAAARLSGDENDTRQVIALMNSPDPEVRMAAMNAAGEMGPAGKAVETVIQSRCTDASPRVRAAAAQSLSRLSPDSPATSQIVSRMLSDPHPDVRGAASVGLLMIPKPDMQAVRAMQSAARSADPRTSQVCASALFRSSGSVVRI